MLQLTEYRKNEKKNRIKLQCSSNENSHELRHVSGLSGVLETFSNFFYLKTWLQVVYLYTCKAWFSYPADLPVTMLWRKLKMFGDLL